MPKRLGGKRDDDLHADQRRERIGKSTGDVNERRQLQQVEGQQQRRFPGLQTIGGGKTGSEKQVGERQCRDQEAAGQKRQGEIEPEGDKQDCRRLSGDRQPAQPDNGLQPYPAAGAAKPRGFDRMASHFRLLYPIHRHHVPRGFARLVGRADAGSSGHGWRG
ncbi:hypothetical protein D3C72_1802500 [compost metagenome]